MALRATQEDCFFHFFFHSDTGTGSYFIFSQPQTSKRPGQRQKAASRSHGAEGRQEGGLEVARTPRVDYLASPACFA